MNTTHTLIARPPVVAIVGHIDHGKSTLLDYIRRTNVVADEAGGITQHLSAYEAEHSGENGIRRITFLDTPGHEAFRAMRSRGLEVADVAVLVVASDDGVMPQTVEAISLIREASIPFIVAFTKCDKQNSNIEKAKYTLLDNEVFLEGMGGDIPFVEVSGKTGQGVSELLDLIVLAADIEGLSADTSLSGRGLVIEGHVDSKRGNTATLIVRDGSVLSGQYVVCGEAYAPVRIMENFIGKKVSEAGPGSPVQIVGFSTLPATGESWYAVESKKEAEADATAARQARLGAQTHATVTQTSVEEDTSERIILPLVIKTDVAGTGDAVMHELAKLPELINFEYRVVEQSVGPITEGDVRKAGAGRTPGIIVGFNVRQDRDSIDLSERLHVTVKEFSIIYKLTQWLAQEAEARRPRVRLENILASARILKIFNTTKNKTVLGGRVESGVFTVGANVKVLRKDEEIARGEISALQVQRVEVKKVAQGLEFGALVKLSSVPEQNDTLVVFETLES